MTDTVNESCKLTLISHLKLLKLHMGKYRLDFNDGVAEIVCETEKELQAVKAKIEGDVYISSLVKVANGSLATQLTMALHAPRQSEHIGLAKAGVPPIPADTTPTAASVDAIIQVAKNAEGKSATDDNIQLEGNDENEKASNDTIKPINKLSFGAVQSNS